MGDGESLVQSNGGSLAEKKRAVVDTSRFSPEEMKKVNEIANQIDMEDSQAIVTYGIGAQREVSTFADNVLTQVRAKDSGYVGEVLTELVLDVKELDVDSLSSGGGFLSRIPIIGSITNSIKKFIARYEKLNVKIDTIVDNLDRARMTLLKDIALLDNMYEKNIEYLKNLEFFIAAGQLKIKAMQEKTLPELKAKADASSDPLDAQKFKDVSLALNRFEKKVHDLQLSRMIALQGGPQVRLIQNSDQTLVEKIQSSILNTIPLWKNQIIIALTLFRQKKALKLQKHISQTTNELLQKNAELLKEGTIEIAKESERGIVDIETLKKVNNDLISTIEETLKIQTDGKIKRKQAESELIKLEDELKKKLTAVKGE